ncbi:Ku protein [Dechloromonas sp. XY25]|uniref:Non-homologous end joining protein Ku n=1 Tax=Dechloromonas hankyongensis TaxID=2908002 RepID=A0ABS9K647_9RHOO|nr:Ku protein [Dechloromonas hankyongensis]MCG2578605.1 Ku protein [Dechloromonas hankyongensis]
MARVIWKGAVSFGLVHIPVALVPATVQRGIDFDWIDRRSMDPVGYKRINKTTGADIAGEDIVRGVQYEKHRYVVLDDDEIRAAYPAATRTVDIVAFVDADEIPPIHFDTPYYLAPEARGEKVYALLREALADSGQAGLAKVVLRNTQHLAVLMPLGPGLLLNTLRWPEEVRDLAELALPEAVTQAKLDPRELDMARRLIADMREDWEPSHYKNEFAAQIMALVERKARQGKLETVGEAAEEGEEGAEIIDLADLLRRSLGRKGGKESKAAAPAGQDSSGGRRSRKKAG